MSLVLVDYTAVMPNKMKVSQHIAISKKFASDINGIVREFINKQWGSYPESFAIECK